MPFEVLIVFGFSKLDGRKWRLNFASEAALAREVLFRRSSTLSSSMESLNVESRAHLDIAVLQLLTLRAINDLLRIADPAARELRDGLPATGGEEVCALHFVLKERWVAGEAAVKGSTGLICETALNS